MTISFNGGADPEEVKFNGQDMETVIFNGVTVWEKVVGVEYTITSAAVPLAVAGWVRNMHGAISPTPSDSLYSIFTITGGLEIVFLNNQTFPISVKYNQVVYNLSSFNLTTAGSYLSANLAANLQPFYNSVNIIGNNTTFELIYP